MMPFYLIVMSFLVITNAINAIYWNYRADKAESDLKKYKDTYDKEFCSKDI